MPDAAMTLAVAALFADGTTTIRDVASWRVKETERMIAICTETRKLGAEVVEGADYCVITPPKGGFNKGVAIDTYDDHRMANEPHGSAPWNSDPHTAAALVDAPRKSLQEATFQASGWRKWRGMMQAVP